VLEYAPLPCTCRRPPTELRLRRRAIIARLSALCLDAAADAAPDDSGQGLGDSSLAAAG
jgi:hypothetical protein